jgi:phenylacetate-CoA ligase
VQFRGQLLIEETFGVPVYNEMARRRMVLLVCRNNKWLLSDELVYTEIIDDAGKSCPNGAVGNVIITSLF